MTEYDEFTEQFHIECDGCGKNAKYDVDNWHHGLNKAKSDGWVSRLLDGEWGNYCSGYCFFEHLPGGEGEITPEPAKIEVVDEDEDELNQLPF